MNNSYRGFFLLVYKHIPGFQNRKYYSNSQRKTVSIPYHPVKFKVNIGPFILYIAHFQKMYLVRKQLIFFPMCELHHEGPSKQNMPSRVMNTLAL